MAKTLFLVAVVLCSFAVGASPQAQTDSLPGASAARSDTSLIAAPFEASISLTDNFEQNTARPLTAYLGVSASRFYGWERYKLSRYECVLQGADMGLTYGLVAGAAGMSRGAWDEPTAWYIAGAAAMLGAIFGNKVLANDPEFRVRLRWEASEHDPWTR
jgi:hypothetical protein